MYILCQKERGRKTHVSWQRKLLDSWRVCCSSWSRDPDRGDFSCGCTAVSGGVFADCVRLRLLPALERSLAYEHRGLEISEGLTWYSSQIVQNQGLRLNPVHRHNGA